MIGYYFYKDYELIFTVWDTFVGITNDHNFTQAFLVAMTVYGGMALLRATFRVFQGFVYTIAACCCNREAKMEDQIRQSLLGRQSNVVPPVPGGAPFEQNNEDVDFLNRRMKRH